MGQKVDVSDNGRIAVENADGSRFDFRVSVDPTATMRLAQVTWSSQDSHLLRLESLDEAYVVARRAAKERGWLKGAMPSTNLGLI